MDYLIDGNNLLLSDDVFFQEGPGGFASARLRLLAALEAFCAAGNHRAAVVFDGEGRLPPPLPHVEVRFSGEREDADGLIERLAREGDAPVRTVVSADRALAARVRMPKVRVQRSEAFLAEVLAAARKGRPGRAPARRDLRLSAAEVDAWIREFGLEGKDPR